MTYPKPNSLQKQKLRRLGVQALYLFGSRAQRHPTPLSDYDYAVLLKEKGHSRLDPLYFELYELLSALSPRNLKNDVIDIVFLKDAGLELCFHVIRYGVLIYEENQKARLDFETKTTLLYCDYQPILHYFDQAILKAV